MKNYLYLSILTLFVYFSPHLAKADLLAAQTATLRLDSLTVAPDNVICMPFIMSGLQSIKGMNFTVKYDPEVIRFQGSQSGVLPQFGSGHYNEIALGEIRVFWAHGSAQGIPLMDNDTLFSLCFRAKGAIEDYSPVVITDCPLNIDFASADSASNDVVLLSGIIEISESGPADSFSLKTLTCLNQGGACTSLIEPIIFGGEAPFTFLWSTGETTPSVLVTEEGEYSLTITDGQGNDLVETYTFDFNSLSCEVEHDTTLYGIVNYPQTYCPLALETNPTEWVLTDSSKIIGSTILAYVDSATNCVVYSADFDENNPPIFLFGSIHYKFCRNDGNDCKTFRLNIRPSLSEQVWPGDTNQDSIVNHFDLLNIGLAYDSIGPARPNASLQWTSQIAPRWTVIFLNESIPYAHIDCDGNGHINALDTNAIVQNWNETVSFINPEFETRGEEEPEYSRAAVPFYVDETILIEGQSGKLDVILGESERPATDVYGLAFTLTYDPEKVVDGSAGFNALESWIGTANTDLLYIYKDFPGEGELKVAVTRTDGQSMDGFGKMGTLSLTIEEDILFRNQGNVEIRNEELELSIGIKDVLLITPTRDTLEVAPRVTASSVITSTKELLLAASEMKIYPNPTQEQLTIEGKDLNIDSVKSYNITGQLISVHESQSSKTTIDTSDWQPGIYLVKVLTDKGVLSQRIVIHE